MATITVLGTGTPTPHPDRWGSSFVVDIQGELLMFDCGPATTYKLVKAGLWPTAVDYLFFTHHHFDHNVDLPTFLLTRWDQSIGEENTLRIFGPSLTEEITEGLIGEQGVFAPDLKARIHDPGSQQIFVGRGGTLPRPAPQVEARNIEASTFHTSPSWEVTAADAVHVQPYLDSLAYRLDTDSGSIVFTGDTAPCESVVELAQDADIMFCMCFDHQEVIDRNDLGNGSGTISAAQMAASAGVERLVLVHSKPSLVSPGSKEKAIDDIRAHFGGDVVFAEELMQIDV